MVIKSSELEVQHLAIGKLEDSNLVKSQKIASISYKRDGLRPSVQTPEFRTETCGIPREGPYYATDKARPLYKLPFCQDRAQFPDEVHYDERALRQA